MAIGYGASLGTTTAGGTNTRSLTSLSISGSDIIMFVAVRTETVSKTVSSLNWDDGSGGSAQAFTQLGTYKDAEGSNHRLSLWYLINPSPSNSRIICTISANDVVGISACYYTGAKQTSPFTTPSQGGPVNYSSQDQDDTSDADGSWHIGAAISGNAGLAFTAGTQRQACPQTGYFADSNAGVNSASSHRLTWGGGSSTAWIMAMMRPAVAAGPANLKTWNGIAKASIKTINGVAIGSVKSVNGIV